MSYSAIFNDLPHGKAHRALAFFLLFTLTGFFILPSGKAHNFVSYGLFISLSYLIYHHLDYLKPIAQKPLSWLIISLLTFLAISGFWSDSTHLADELKLFGRVLFNLSFILSLVIIAQRWSSFYQWFIASLTLSAVVSVFVSSILFYETVEFGAFLSVDNLISGQYRLEGYGRLHNSVIAGVCYGFVALLCFYQCLHCKQFKIKLLYSIGCAILMIAVGLTVTRAALLAMGIVMLIWFWFRFRWGALAGLGLVLIVFSMLLVHHDQLYLQANALLERGQGIRFTLWQTVWHQVIASDDWSWLFGMGALTASQIIVENVSVFQHPHSLYLATFYYGGLLATLLLLALLTLTVHTLYQQRRHPYTPLIAGLLLYGMIIFIFDGHLILKKVDYIWLTLWCPIALTLSHCLASIHSNNHDQ